MVASGSRVGAAALLLSVGGLFGCDSGPEQRTADFGAFCVTRAPDDAVEVRVSFYSCDRNCDCALEASCEVTVSDGKIEITARAVIESWDADECPANCAPLEATCRSTEKLGEGEVIAEFRDYRSDPFTPGEEATCLSSFIDRLC